MRIRVWGSCEGTGILGYIMLLVHESAKHSGCTKHTDLWKIFQTLEGKYFTFHTDNLEIYTPVTCPIKEVGPEKLVYFCTLALAPFQTFSFILESCIVLSNCFIFGGLTGTCWCSLFLLRCFRRYLTEFTGVHADLCFSNELDVRSREWCLRHFPWHLALA